MRSAAFPAYASSTRRRSRAGRYQARVVFLCASTIRTAQILLASTVGVFLRMDSRTAPDAVGRYLMDHVMGIGAAGTHPGFLDRYYYGRRPTGFYLPRYVNLTENGRRLRAGLRFPGLLGTQHLDPRGARSGRRRRAQAAAAQSGTLGDAADRLRRDAAARRQPRDPARDAQGPMGDSARPHRLSRTATTSAGSPSARTAMPRPC